MPTSLSTHRKLILPDATASGKRLADIQAVKSSLIKIDDDIDILRRNSASSIIGIHGGGATTPGYITTSGYGIDPDPVDPIDPPPDTGGGGGGGGTWVLGQTAFAFTGASYTPTANFAF